MLTYAAEASFLRCDMRCVSLLSAVWHPLTYAGVCWRMLTYAAAAGVNGGAALVSATADTHPARAGGGHASARMEYRETCQGIR